ncbi:MAG: hypothetical protein KDK64_06080 [Chlamydiia bacterium]|nr:hypothetical protein [Chlamydiia bacterium]
MTQDDLLAYLNEEGLSEAERLKRLQELHAEGLLYDDHGSAIIGSRSQAPLYPKDN